MTHPTVAQKAPYPSEVQQDQTYFWCACGRSAQQPFCDGSHKGSGITPVKYTAKKDQKIYFCGCKHSLNQPMCDGTHGKI